MFIMVNCSVGRDDVNETRERHGKGGGTVKEEARGREREEEERGI